MYSQTCENSENTTPFSPLWKKKNELMAKSSHSRVNRDWIKEPSSGTELGCFSEAESGFGLGIPRLNTALGVSVKVFQDVVSIWVVGSTKQIALPTVDKDLQSSEGLEQMKEQKQEQFAALASCLSPEVGHLISSSPALRLGFTPAVPLVFRPSDSEWIYSPSSSLGLPACRKQIMTLPSIHNHMC